jgi:tetratricopeptide (TPR) repeat protein
MDEAFLALHRAILGVDIEGFADRRRTNPDQVVTREGLYRCLETAFARSDISFGACYHEDRGDGMLILVPPEIPKDLLVSRLPGELTAALLRHNEAHPAGSRIRIRLVVHAGEVHRDRHGVAGTAINVAFRLLEASELKQALRQAPGPVALIASGWFYEEVIRHSPASQADSYRHVRISVKETSELAWISLPPPDSPPRPAGGRPGDVTEVGPPRQLPAAISCFAGRDAELQRLNALLDDDRVSADAMVITAVGGMPGVGKTALAVYWAQQVASRFPDGQLYVNLRGFDPRGLPVPAAEAIRGFLDAFGIPAEKVPRSLDDQASMFRSRLAGRQVLVVLDNARDVEQVRPLLPGSPGCLVLVTSRNQLTGLIAAGAHPLLLDLPTGAEAWQLLERRLGAGRLAAEPGPAREMSDLCGRLPLALGVAAARAATHPDFPLAALADELRSSRERLDAFEGGDPAATVRAVFSWSYRQLGPAAARMFQALGTYPGPDIAAPAAASLAGLPVATARSALQELARSNLITEPAAGRFTLHDLLRAYAAEKAVEDAGAKDDGLPEAIRRVLDHYLHTALAASQQFSPFRPALQLGDPRPGVLPVGFADSDQAAAWFDAEVPVLLALAAFAGAGGFGTYAWQIAWTLGPFLHRRGRIQDYIATQQTALAAARRLGDPVALAHAQHLLSHALAQAGDHAPAGPGYEQALALFRQLGDQANEATVLNGLAGLLEKQRRYDEALAVALDALRILTTIGHWRTQATLENGVGWLYAHLGQDDEALTHCQRALGLHRESGHRGGAADTLDSLGYIYLHLGDLAQARAHYAEAIETYRELGVPFGVGNSLAGLGEVQLAAGEPGAARDSWQRALSILREVPSYDTARLELDLAGLEDRLAGSADPVTSSG